MTAHQAHAISGWQRAMLWTLRRLGWTVQGQLGAHFRPIILVTAPCRTTHTRLIWLLLWKSLPDRGRIVRITCHGDEDVLREQLTRHRPEARWLTCIGVDAKRKRISIHRPFHPSPFPERDAVHIERYLAYFEGQTSSPPPTEAARAAEREGY